MAVPSDVSFWLYTRQTGYKCYHPHSLKYFVSKDITFHENVCCFTRPQPQGENIYDCDTKFEFPILGLCFPETPVTIPAPSSTFEPETFFVPVPSFSSVLHESEHSTPILVYQRRSKFDLL
jgi:hypothetical protein